jgi:hypothetical protein
VQSVQADWLVRFSVDLPAAHDVHDELAAALEKRPRPHARHAVAPVEGWYVPGSQSVHVDASVVIE